jgi:hypothetical protein
MLRTQRALTSIAEFCESVLLDAGFVDQAYARYAVEATHATTNLATFKAIVKKYPNKPKETILRDLVASQPGQEGKWFAAAKNSGFFELAIELGRFLSVTKCRNSIGKLFPEHSLRPAMPVSDYI